LRLQFDFSQVTGDFADISRALNQNQIVTGQHRRQHLRGLRRVGNQNRVNFTATTNGTAQRTAVGARNRRFARG
jgi:hypothetical protein